MSIRIGWLFDRLQKYDGVRRINVYLMRVFYLLMATLLAMDVWVRGMPRTTVQGRHGRAGRRSRMRSREGGAATPYLIFQLGCLNV